MVSPFTFSVLHNRYKLSVISVSDLACLSVLREFQVVFVASRFIDSLYWKYRKDNNSIPHLLSIPYKCTSLILSLSSQVCLASISLNGKITIYVTANVAHEYSKSTFCSLSCYHTLLHHMMKLQSSMRCSFMTKE